jgi:DNA-3-methyladenine glycosylase II
MLEGRLDLCSMEILSDEEVRARLITLKGVGNWTIDVYLIFVLHRADIFPAGDLAAVNAMRQIKAIPKETTREILLGLVDRWRPYRSIATMLLWHHYLSSRKRKSQ